MTVASGRHALAAEELLALGVSKKFILGSVCLCAGVAPLAAKWIPDDVARIAYGLVITVSYLAFALFATVLPGIRDS